MNIDELTTNVAQQFLEEDQENVTSEVQFRQLETYDSLTGMAILSIIKDEYGVEIPVDEYTKLNTVKELYEYIVNNK